MAEAAAALAGIHTNPRRGPVLRDVSLAVQDGEILTLLGSAGAGKTTVLRLLAGFARPKLGRVTVRGRDVTRLPPGRSGAVLIESGLGLFAGMTVRQALAFVDPDGQRTQAALQLAGLQDRASWRPAQLAPGERVLLAVVRALAAAPRVLLLDDVARGLDRGELDRLFGLLRAVRAKGLGMICATRDAAQAIALGDCMAVLAAGAVLQSGVPQAVYDRPADASVAALTGPVNTLPGAATEADEMGVRVRLDAGTEVEASAGPAADGLHPGARCVVCVRPERVAMSVLPPEQLGDGAFAATVVSVTHHGADGRLQLLVDGTTITVVRPAGGIPPGVAAGRRVSLAWQAHHAMAYAMIAPTMGTQVAGAVSPR